MKGIIALNCSTLWALYELTKNQRHLLLRRRVVVWVNTLCDLQALIEPHLRIGPESPPPPSLLRRCQFLPLPRYMYMYPPLLYLSIAFNLLFQTFSCGKINSACLLHVKNNSYQRRIYVYVHTQ